MIDKIAGTPIDLRMKLGENGEAYFVDPAEEEDLPDYLVSFSFSKNCFKTFLQATSPLPYDIVDTVSTTSVTDDEPPAVRFISFSKE